MKTLGEKIKTLRRKKGLSQEDLGFELNLTRQTISNWELNVTQPTIENIKLLCEFFNVEAAYFVSEGDIATNATQTNEVATTTVASPEPNTEIATANSNTKRKIIILTALISVSAVVLIFGLIICGFAIYDATAPALGKNDTHVVDADMLAIVCGVLAFVGIVTVITSIILLKSKKNRKM